MPVQSLTRVHPFYTVIPTIWKEKYRCIHHFKFLLTHIQWHPPLIGHYTNFWPLLIWTLLPNLTFYLIVQGFHRTYATGAACQQRTLTPPDTWSCPTLGLAYVLMSRPISPELVLSPDFWISNTPRYFSFADLQYGPYAHFGYWTLVSDPGPNKLFKKMKSYAQKVPKQAKAVRDGVIKPQNIYMDVTQY